MTDKEIYQLMLDELESSELRVALSPAPSPAHTDHKIRVSVSKNVKWYQDLCRRHPSSRQDNPGGKRTKIKRASICNILKQLAAGKTPATQYLPELKAVMEQKKQSTPF
jgi:hypothetical protein